jgi:nicotinate-nucleotide--dimethylbenzimidazole phosphoribosyltransferase
VLLDGLVGQQRGRAHDELAKGAREWWLYAQRSPDPAMGLVEEHLGLSPVLDLGVRLGDGTGAMAAVPLLQMAARLLAETDPS